MEKVFESSGAGTRTAFWLALAGGMALCTRGIGRAVEVGWTHPISISGYLLGALALLLGGVMLFKRPIGPVRSERSALIALLGIALVKIVLAALY